MRPERRNENGGGIPDQPDGNDEVGPLPLEDTDEALHGLCARPECKRPGAPDEQNAGRGNRECAVV